MLSSFQETKKVDKIKHRFKTECDQSKFVLKNNKQQKCKNGYIKNIFKVGLPELTNLTSRFILKQAGGHHKKHSNIQIYTSQRKHQIQNKNIQISKMSCKEKQNLLQYKKKNASKMVQFDRSFNIRSNEKIEKFICSSHLKPIQIKQQRLIRFIKGKYVIVQLQRLFGQMKGSQLLNFQHDVLNISKINLQQNIIDAWEVHQKYHNQLKTILGKLMHFLAVEIIEMKNKNEISFDWKEEITRCLHYQIYYSLLLRIPMVAMQCLIENARIFANYKQFNYSEYNSQIALKIAIFYENMFYEESAMQQIGMCEYKRGNVHKATEIHDNIGKISSWSRMQISKSYNQQNYLKALKNYLFDNFKIDINRHIPLIQTIVFNKQIRQEQNQINKNVSIKISRMFASDVSKNINQFRMHQQKLNDLRKISNQKAIKNIRAQYLHFQQISHQDEKLHTQVSDKRTNMKSCLTNINSSKHNKSIPYIQDRKRRNSTTSIAKNMKDFAKFLACIQKALLSKLQN